MTAEPARLRVPRAPTAPPDLGLAGIELWERITRAVVIEDIHRDVLTIAAHAVDRAADAAAVVRQHGLLIDGAHGGLVSNPAVAHEREAQRTALRALRQLGLDLEPPSAPT